MSPAEVIAPGRVAVVTGAASGIGLALSRLLAHEGMSVVMADVEEPALAAAAAGLADDGAKVVAVPADVTSEDQVTALRDAAVAQFGAVHLLCNNAGVAGAYATPLWEVPAQDWDWVMRVNLGGAVHGIRAFVPLLLEQDAAHVLNTGSVFGTFAGSIGPYGVSKHAVVALSETLHFQLAAARAAVGVSVLCPGTVATRLPSSARNRPATGPSAASGAPVPGMGSGTALEYPRVETLVSADPADVAAAAVAGIRAGQLYIVTASTPRRDAAIRRRGEEILAGGPPERPFP